MKKIQKLFKEFYNRICGHVRGWLQHLESSETSSLMTNHKYIYACITLVICIGSSIFYVSKGSLNIFIIIAFVCCLCIYFILYTFLNLSKSIFSFVLFSILMLMFILFLRGFLLVCKGFSHPIFVEQISIFSQYRYIIFTIGALLIFILYVFAFFFSKIKHLLDIMSFPYLKEEVRRILYTWHNSFVGDFCIKLIYNLYESKKAIVVYNAINFSNYLFRFIIATLFINCCFFKGDLRVIFYMIPLVFVFWIFNFFKYYFLWFVDTNSLYVRDLLCVTLKEDVLSTEDNLIHTNKENLQFKFTSYALQEGYYGDISLNSLSDSWLRLAVVSTKVKFFDNFFKNMSIMTFVLNFFCWSYISFLFVSQSSISFFGFEFFLSPLFRRTPFVGSGSQILRYSPRDARFVHEKHMNDLKKATGGAYSPGHPIYGEQKPNTEEYRMDGSFTHGTGTIENPSQPLLGSSVDANSKDQRPQHHIPLKEPASINKNWLKPPIPGSEAYFNRDDVKNSLDTLYSNKVNGSKEE